MTEKEPAIDPARFRDSVLNRMVELRRNFDPFTIANTLGLSQGPLLAEYLTLADILLKAAESPTLSVQLDTLELSIRTANGLKNEGLQTIGDVLRTGGARLLRSPNFGRKSLNEVKEVLAQLGHTLN